MRSAIAFAMLLVAATATAAEPAPLTARLACRPEASPGRVSCELEVEIASGRLAWVDALVTHSPGFARPLRARIGMRQATAQSERRVRLPVTLVATSTGKGEVVVQSRSVVCRRTRGRDEVCIPVVRVVTAAVQVGPVEEARP